MGHVPPPDDDDLDEPTWPEIGALQGAMRDRESYLRQLRVWAAEWPKTELLESLITKLRRVYHRRHPEGE